VTAHNSSACAAKFGGEYVYQFSNRISVDSLQPERVRAQHCFDFSHKVFFNY